MVKSFVLGLSTALTVFVGLATAERVSAESADLTGFIAGELRIFPDAPQFDDQFSVVQPSFVVNPEFGFGSADRRHQVSIVPFLRLDGQDSNRTHVDLREAYWRYLGDDFELLLGLNRVFWGVTESRHLVNVINQVDAVEDLDGEDFLGQPMVHLALERDWGRIGGYLLPGFRPRTFPGARGRLRPGPPVNESEARYQSRLKEASIDAALRYAHYFGNWDIGASLFHGTSREPRLLFDPQRGQLIPFYDRMHQVGLDAQYTEGAWLWKFEAIAQKRKHDAFVALVGGFEHSFYQVADTLADVGLLAEFLHDGRNETESPATIFDNDLFLGARLTLNDFQDTSLLVGGLLDIGDGSSSLRLEGERRLSDQWSVDIEAQWFISSGDSGALKALRDDSYITLRLSQHF